MHLVYPQNSTLLLFPIPPGYHSHYKEIGDSGYAKFWGVNEVHYGLYKNGKWCL